MNLYLNASKLIHKIPPIFSRYKRAQNNSPRFLVIFVPKDDSRGEGVRPVITGAS